MSEEDNKPIVEQQLETEKPAPAEAPAAGGDFESTHVFADDPVTPAALTPEEEFEQSFNETVEGEGPADKVGDKPDGGSADKPEPPAKRIIDTMTDAELKSVFDKARQVDALNERLTKTHKDAFGRIGGIEQAIRELKEAKKAEPQAVELKKEQFKHVAEYYGQEDDDGFLDALVKDLSALQLGIPMTPNLDVEARFAEEQARINEMQQANQQRLDEMQRDLQAKMLSFQHPDWQDYNTNPDKAKAFIDWQMTLTEQDRTKIAQASQDWDAQTLSHALTKYKAFEAKKAEHEQQKAQRLAGNIPPTRGNSAERPPPNLDNDYEANFQKAVRGQMN